MPGLLARWQTSDVHLRSPLQHRQYELLADRIADERPDRVLDWGCGYRQVTALLRERGVEVSSYDFRPDAPEKGETVALERYPGATAAVISHPVRLPTSRTPSTSCCRSACSST